MKKLLVVFSVIVSLFMTGLSAFAFGLPSVPKVAQGSGSNPDEVRQQIAKIVTTSDMTTQTYNNSILQLNSLLGTKEEIAKLQEVQNNSTKDVKTEEKGAIAGAVVTEAENNLLNIAQQKDLKDKISAFSTEQKSLLTDCLYNVALSNLSFATLVTDSSSLVKTISSDPTTAAKVSPDLIQLKEVAANTPKQVASAVKVSSALIKVVQSSGVKFTEPKSISETPKPVKNFEF